MDMVLDPAALRGAAVTGTDTPRTPLGRVERVYLDALTGVATWALVDGHGLGGHRCLVPLSAARLDGTILRVPYSAAELVWGPPHDPSRDLTTTDQRDLDAYYASLTPAAPTQVTVDGANPTTEAEATTDTGHPATAHHPVAPSEEAAP